MSVITVPASVLGASNSASIALIRKDASLETMSGSEIIVAPPGTKWLMSVRIRPMNINAARQWQAILIQLAKLSNTCEVTPPGWVSGTGYSGPNGAVQAGSQTGMTLTADGFTAGAAISLAGDYISFNGELKMLTADATANGSGVVTFAFEPAIRQSPADNAAVEVKAPVLTARMVNPQAAWDIQLADIYNFELTLLESY